MSYFVAVNMPKAILYEIIFKTYCQIQKARYNFQESNLKTIKEIIICQWSLQCYL